MRHFGFDPPDPPEYDALPSELEGDDAIFDYVFESEDLIEQEVEHAIGRVLDLNNSTGMITDNIGNQVGHYIGDELYIDDLEAIKNAIAPVFDADTYRELFDDHRIAQIEADRQEDMDYARELYYSDYDGDY